jgi:hypothetical protein
MIDPTVVRAPTQAGALKKKSVNEGIAGSRGG